ncbi:CPBP family intramembrane metalloprotease [Sphingomonas sp. JC676]|uniref:CPBP family intramembrane glutamic endopeptidase n=1 Tax=Sphingomonas sp. JC676 TaxID=2768065 RepID=UPI001657E623|nr:CPBP family intramembrane glutamic endopeptidase [Sphingomonas sp. JC676]MBC9033223.1 CPBP family intramembrane metalloprotease [Sphingomonas sp. JC676]
MLLAALLLAVAIGAYAHFVRHDARVFSRFKTVTETQARQRVFLRWTWQAAAYFLGMPLIGLALLGRIEALWSFPAEFAPAATDMPEIGDMSAGFIGALAGAVFAGGVIGGVLASRRRKPAKPRKAIDIDAMIPRNRAETLRVALLGANAALTEEVCFRLYIPLLFMPLGASPWIGFGAAALLFGAMHRYQGWLGVVLTSLLGMMFAFAYLASGGLALPILLHLLLNWNGLILRPMIKALASRRAD